jgi:TonB-dependent starch-binding outer membrane protein SusC
VSTQFVGTAFRVRLGAALVAMMTLATAARAQQEARINVRVIDAAEHAPIPTAQVQFTGTTVGAMTSDSGTFSLRMPSGATSMVIRRIGYIAQTVTLTPGKTDYVVALQRDVLRLDVQVVTGVATTVASSNAANAVSVVTTDEVNRVPVPTIENALEGKIPGAIIQANNGGSPGGGMQIQVRGITSINANASPLYVIDGVEINNQTVNADDNAINGSGGGQTSTGQRSSGAPSCEDNSTNRIADINPDDIESIEVLKGASASAIYGSKASAGVIIITTKKGTSGKPRWTVNGQVGKFQMSNEYSIRTFATLQNAQQWWNFAQNGYNPDSARLIGIGNSYIAANYHGPQDFQRQLFSNPLVSNQLNVSVAGTSGPTQYFLSGLTMYNNGIMNNTGYNKQAVRANVTETFAPNLLVGLNMSYANTDTRQGITGNDNIGISPYNVFSTLPGFLALNKKLPDGSWPLTGQSLAVNFGPANPFADAAEIETPEEVSRFIGGGSLNWTPLKLDNQTLAINLNGGADLASLNDQLYAPPFLQVEQVIASGLPGTAVSNTSQINYYNYALSLVHHYTGFSFLDATTSLGFTRDKRSLVNPVTVGYNLLNGTGAPTAGSVIQNFYNKTAQNDQSVYLQEQLIMLDNKLTLTGGIDGERSTINNDINKFFWYPHFAGSYRTPAVAMFDEFKLRAAYGQSGNLGNYGSKYTPLFPTVIDGVGGVARPSQLGDPTLTPEAETEMEMGFDAPMWHSRAQFSATVYRKTLTSLVLLGGVAPSYGYTQLYLNGGQFTNEGIELEFQATPVQTRSGFTWTTTNTYFRNYSVVNKLPVPNFTAGQNFGYGADYVAPGRSLSEIANPNVFGANGLPIQVGDFSPGGYLSFGNEFNYHGFRVFGLVDWSLGGQTINLTTNYFDFGAHLYPQADSAATAVRRIQASNLDFEPYTQTAQFFKVRELELSYTLPGNVVSQLGGGRVTNIRVALTGYNMWSIFGYKGLDPEVSAFGNQAVGRGYDVTPYPPARSFYFGLNLGL